MQHQIFSPEKIAREPAVAFFPPRNGGGSGRKAGSKYSHDERGGESEGELGEGERDGELGEGERGETVKRAKQ